MSSRGEPQAELFQVFCLCIGLTWRRQVPSSTGCRQFCCFSRRSNGLLAAIEPWIIEVRSGRVRTPSGALGSPMPLDDTIASPVQRHLWLAYAPSAATVPGARAGPSAVGSSARDAWATSSSRRKRPAGHQPVTIG